MTDIEFINTLKPLEQKMKDFENKRDGSLTIDDVNIIKAVYDKLRELNNNAIKNRFNGSCGSCIRETFRILIATYNRIK